MPRHGHKQWLVLLKVVLALSVICYLLWIYRHLALHISKFLWDSTYRSCVHRKRSYELEEQSTPLYVTKEKHGRLGNWLFGYASLLGIAKANGYIPYLLATHPLNWYFQLSKVQKKPAECLFPVYDNLPCTYTPAMMNLPTGNVTIDGYIQSWKYFRFMNDELRAELKIRPAMALQAHHLVKEHVGQYLAEGRLVISIHVRRGDVLKPEARKLGFCHAPAKYFENAMKYMLQLYPYSVFLVMSDDIGWCKENIKPLVLSEVMSKTKLVKILKDRPNMKASLASEKVPIVFSRSRSMWEDFTMLTLSNHSIISVGSFGWWGAWFANGHVVYYDSFPLPGTKVDYEMNKEDYFPPEWVALSVGAFIQPWLYSYAYLFLSLSIAFLVDKLQRV